MPHMNGRELADRVVRKYTDVRVLFTISAVESFARFLGYNFYFIGALDSEPDLVRRQERLGKPDTRSTSTAESSKTRTRRPTHPTTGHRDKLSFMLETLAELTIYEVPRYF